MRTENPRIVVGADMSGPEWLDFCGGTAAVFSARCPGDSGGNEDAAALIAYGSGEGILAVADGLGGAPSGEEAARLAVRALASAMERGRGAGAPLRSAILDAFEDANRAVSALGVGAATTLAVVEVGGGAVRPYHVGDTEVLLVGGRRKVKLQTISHSPVGYGVEAGLIDVSDAMRHKHRHLVSNMVGTADMRIEVGPRVRLAARDTLLVGSDGPFDNLRRVEIAEIAAQGTLQDAARILADSCRDRMRDPQAGAPSKPDDLTFIAFRWVTQA